MYLVVAFVASLTLALIAQRVGIERYLKPSHSGGRDRGRRLRGPEPDAARRGLRRRRRSSMARVRRRSPRRPTGSPPACSGRSDHCSWSGVAIGLAIDRLVSADRLQASPATTARSPFRSPPGSAHRCYFSTELFVPIADSLHAAGVGVGAIVALTIAGAGANVPEFVILSKSPSRGSFRSSSATCS